MEEPRRSSRANKGVHSGRDLQELYYFEDEHISKKAKTESTQGALDATLEIVQPKEVVRCTPCGTTDANYDEETDTGGLMIECEKCTTWQHAKCMNYNTKLSIPKVYECDICLKSQDQKTVQKSSSRETSFDPFYLPPKRTSSQPIVVNAKEAKKNAALAAIQKTRDSVSRALLNVIAKTNPTLTEAAALSTKIETAVFEWAHGTDKKYIDKSRAIMALVKKPVVLERLTKSEISAVDLTTLPVEEIDPELKHYAERVRQELIRRSVLVVEDEQSQRVRRTHKGEELVESVHDEGSEHSINLTMRDKSKSHFVKDNGLKLSLDSSRNSIYSNQHPSNMYQVEDDDDEESESKSRTASEIKLKSDTYEDSISDDDMDLILERSPKTHDATQNSKPDLKPKSSLPPIMPSGIWSGQIEFPDFATSTVQAQFVSCTKYQIPNDTNAVRLHNRAIRVCKEIIDSPKILVQGRLDRKKADPYVEKVSLSRDLFLIKLNNRDEDFQFNKLFKYFVLKSKVGVISCQATCVKDAYLYAIDGEVPKFLNFAPGIGEGLYMLYIVKKDYIPVGKSILKKKALPVQQHTTPAPSLNAILSKLGGPSTSSSNPQTQQRQGHLPPKPAFVQDSPSARRGLHLTTSTKPVQNGQLHNNHNYAQASSGLTQDQLFFLSEIVNLNGKGGSNQPSMLNAMQNNSH